MQERQVRPGVDGRRSTRHLVVEGQSERLSCGQDKCFGRCDNPMNAGSAHSTCSVTTTRDETGHGIRPPLRFEPAEQHPTLGWDSIERAQQAVDRTAVRRRKEPCRTSCQFSEDDPESDTAGDVGLAGDDLDPRLDRAAAVGLPPMRLVQQSGARGCLGGTLSRNDWRCGRLTRSRGAVPNPHGVTPGHWRFTPQK